MKKLNNIIILSCKSAGSSALQNYFVRNCNYKTVKYTSHQENETLYWSKVASILEHPQKTMYRSVVPYKKEDAITSLNNFLGRNININDISISLEAFIYYYRALVLKFGPSFIEKSPHHLYNRSNLELIASAYESLKKDVKFCFIGLIRHPLDVIYSGWKRWGYHCDSFEKEWLVSYENLLWAMDFLPMQLIRYEDLVAGAMAPEDVLDISLTNKDFIFKRTSIKRWKADKGFGHSLHQDTIDLAIHYGYDDFENDHDSFLWWRNRNWIRTKEYLLSIKKDLFHR